MLPKLAIVLPFYNALPFLERAIASVLEQRVASWELIAVNDASTDNGLELLQKYQQQDKRIKVIDLKENKGQGHARNLALQKAQGHYVLFLDADDFFSKDAFKKLLETIEKKPKTEVFVWGFATFKEGRKNQKQSLPQKPEKHKGETPFQLGMMSRKGFAAFPWVYAVKKSFLEKHRIRFSEGIFFEDIQFSMQLLFHAKKVSVLPYAGYHYRKHSASVTGRSSKQKIDHKFTAFTQIKTFLEEKRVFPQYQSAYLARFLTFCVFTCFTDYFSLSKKERDQELDAYMKRIRKSKLLRKENLLLLRNIGLSLSKDQEKAARRAYLAAYVGLSGIKKRYVLQRFLTRFFLQINRLRS